MDQSPTSSTTDPAAGALISLRCLLEQITSRINDLPYTLFCAAVVIAAVTVNGLWTTPALDTVWLIAADITRDPFPETADADWLLTSWLTPALAWLAGAAATPRMFALFCGGLLAACYAAMCVMFRLRVGEPTARILILVLVTSPLATVLLTWIGYGDPLSVALASAILLLPPLWLRGGLCRLACGQPCRAGNGAADCLFSADSVP
jgi:hypothetical protein